jgi:transcriptional regulator with XRE-family HTH domain
MRNLRNRFGWTLKEMSQKSGIPLSTLSKVEHDRLTLTYEKLQQVSQRLKVPMSDLFADAAGTKAPMVTGRRSIGRIEDAVRVTTPNYDYFYLSTELRRKQMIPILTRIRAKTLEEFGDLSGIVYNVYTKRLVGGHQRVKVLPPDAEIVIETSYTKSTKVGTVSEGYVVINGERLKYRSVDWPEEKEKAANISANKHGGEFDMSVLSEWLLDLDHSNFDLELTGFDVDELTDILAPVNEPKEDKPGALIECPHCGESFEQKRIKETAAKSAQRKLDYHIKAGNIKKPTECEECKATAKLDGAHYNYDEPFKVRWLCRSCHVKWDKKDPKGGTKLVSEKVKKDG